jgi:hypothetical protein
MGMSCKGTGQKRNAYNILEGKPEVKTPFGKHRFRWKYNTEQNSVALVLKRTTPTERPPLAGEVSANFSG